MPSDQTQNISTVLTAYFAVIGIIMVLSIIFSIVIYWRIFSKAGYSGALSLLMFVPIANIVMLCVLAFAEWPIYQELNMLRQQVAMMRGPQFPPPQTPYPPSQDGSQYPQNPQYPQYPQQNQYRQG